jgi:hypothetical protein
VEHTERSHVRYLSHQSGSTQGLAAIAQGTDGARNQHEMRAEN